MSLVFYDIETTIDPNEIIEFGAIVLDIDGFYEIESYSTLIYSDKVDEKSIAFNGITQEMLEDAPTFEEVSDKIFHILNNRIWAGHNIIEFDNKFIFGSFGKIGKQAPRYLDIIDTLPLLRKTFGRRTPDQRMKMASLGNYFALGQERHRALEDVKMTIEVLKNCSLTLFLEQQTNYGKYTTKPAKEDSRTIKIVDQAMREKRDIWISYNGGTIPLVPRKILPKRWSDKPYMVEAYCYNSNKKKYFAVSKITDVRDREWSI